MTMLAVATAGLTSPPNRQAARRQGPYSSHRGRADVMTISSFTIAVTAGH
ncbi:MAG TPA: hypothetical protein PLK19_15785 [Mycobacterium sp.]|jgi:hypothetical protein|nr:hypothetical protein [Mycobacterium sp.]